MEPITTYRDWPIYSLPNYSTPYFYAGTRLINGRKVEGPACNYRSIKAVERRIDRQLDKAKR